MKIIIQAGGKGTRLEGLTRNKPKCLVPVNNLPIIFHIFEKFKNDEFIIIADYKTDVLVKYLKTFAKQYKYKIIKAAKKGTISGIKDALNEVNDNEPFIIMWSDLILSEDFKFPPPSAIGNYIGISVDFECRWSYIDDKFIKISSKENGVAGFFIFENKKLLNNIEEEGAFVDWLNKNNFKFKRLNLNNTKEIGTILAYSETASPKCRPFNSIEFKNDLVIKKANNEYGEKIAEYETAWYKHVQAEGYLNIPEIYEYEPLKMKKVSGKNIWEYDCLTKSQKKDILNKIIEALQDLHNLEPAQKVNIQDCEDNFINKTYERLSKVEELVPFADKEFIKINNNYYRNILFFKKEFENAVKNIYPSEFRLIHGDCTFSNIMFDTYNMKAVLIDPRGYFGKTKFYGDIDYDWAKLYYSIAGEYDQFNRKKFTLDIRENEVEFAIKPNNWNDMEEYFFDCIPNINKFKIKLLHAIIWLSLTTYAWEDYDSICGAFYNGIVKMGKVL